MLFVSIFMDHTNSPVNQDNNLGKDASMTQRVYNLTYDRRENRAKEIK